MTACIGTNFNNDGTALYQATAALFMAQALGYSLSLVDQVVIILTTLVASVGAGGIPSGSFVTLPLIFAAAWDPEPSGESGESKYPCKRESSAPNCGCVVWT